jgi:mono/diheme cytochrome c family protein
MKVKSKKLKVKSTFSFGLLLFTFSFVSGCTRDFKYQPLGMWNDARLEPMEGGPMPGRPSSALLPPAGTVARGQLASFDPVNSGRSGGQLVTQSPVPVTPALIERGQQRYNIYCSPCHSRVGDGQGMIVQRGFPPPPDYAIRRLRRAPIGHFYDVITNGYGVMYSYAERVPVNDRWAIAAYIRVLQELRPEVPDDPAAQAARRRARESGVPDPARGIRLSPEETRGQGPGDLPNGHAAPPPAPGAGH